MNRNSWLDKWMSLPRGQRRATVVLLCVIVVLCGLQMYVRVQEHYATPSATDYSVIQQEIDRFRSHLDSVPLSARRKPYVRHTKVVRDSVGREVRHPVRKYPALEPVPRAE